MGMRCWCISSEHCGCSRRPSPRTPCSSPIQPETPQPTHYCTRQRGGQDTARHRGDLFSPCCSTRFTTRSSPAVVLAGTSAFSALCCRTLRSRVNRVASVLCLPPISTRFTYVWPTLAARSSVVRDSPSCSRVARIARRSASKMMIFAIPFFSLGSLIPYHTACIYECARLSACQAKGGRPWPPAAGDFSPPSR